MSDHANEPDLVTNTLDYVDRLFDLFHDTILRPLYLVGRTLAYAAVILAAACVIVVAVVVGATRLLDSYAFSAHHWLTPLTLGSLLTMIGVLIWRRRRPLPTKKKS